MDFGDIGSRLEEMQREQALARFRAGQTPAAVSAQWCEEPGCGARIPKARRLAIPGVTRCVDCQTRTEKKKRAGL